MVSAAIIRDVKAVATFTPSLVKKEDGTSEIKYDVKYELVGGNYNAEYNKVVYYYNGKVKSATMPDDSVV